MKSKIGIISFFLSISFFSLFIFKPSFAEDAALLPNAVQQFFDNNGNPLSSGKVYFYEVGTTTFKDTYTSSAATTVNQNPITLNAGGKAPTGGIYGIGLYRQVVRDRNNNLIWDAVTAPGGGGTTPTEVGDGNLVGTVLPWSGIVAPNQYLFAYGQEINRNDYSVFYTAVTQQLNVICTSASNILTGVSDTTQIKIGSPVEAALCLAAGTTVVSKTTSTVTVSNPSSVSINTSATFFPYGNGNGSTTFNVPDLRGYAIAGRDNMGGTAASRLTSTYFAEAGLGAVGGSQSHTLLTAELPAIKPAITITDPGHTHLEKSRDGGAGTSGIGSAQSVGATNTSDVSTVSSTTGITAEFTNNLGSDTAFSIVQPTITLNYIIKVTPDTSTSIATGVYSIGGMTGIISCGSGLSCTGNIISSIGAGTGTVTSVALTMPSIFSVSGSPITNSGTLAVTANGTSGGFPYFNSSNTMASTTACSTSTTVMHGGSPPSCSQIVNGDITTNTISNDKLAQAVAVSLKGNPTSSTNNVQDFTIGGLTQLISPNTSSDMLLIWDSASNVFKKITPNTIASASVAGVSSVNSLTGVLTINNGLGIAAIGASGGTITISIDNASSSNYLSGTSNKVVTSDVVYQSETTTTYGTTTTFDFNTFYNTKVTLTGNITTMNCNNIKTGQSGTIRFIQDGSGNHTTVWCSSFKWAGGSSPSLSTAASTVDALVYSCSANNYCIANLLKNVQ